MRNILFTNSFVVFTDDNGFNFNTYTKKARIKVGKKFH